jgi:MFS family permease
VLNIMSGARRDLSIALAGRVVSRLGDGIALVALTLRIQGEGAQPYQIALMLGSGIVPQLLLSGLVGRLADTHDSRRLLVGAGLLEAACAAPLIVTHSVVAITVLVAVLGAAVSLESATWSALLPRIVGEEHVAKAVSTQQSLQALVMVAGPAAGGLMAGLCGTGVPLAFDAITYVVLAGAAALVRTRRLPAPSGAETVPGAPGGFDLLRRDRLLWPLLVGLVMVVLLVGMVDVVLVFLVRVTLRAGGPWYGVAEASWMAGMVAGSLGAGLLKTERRQSWAAIIGAAVACAALAPFAVVPSVWMLVPLSIAGGAGNGYAGVAFSALLVSRMPDAVRGRVSAAVNAALAGAQGLSLLVGGILATALTPREIYAVGGLLGLAVAVAVGVLHAARVTARSQPLTHSDISI